MIKRIIEVSNPAYLHLRNSQMIVQIKGQNDSSVPVEDMGILILANPAITISQGLIASCQENNCIIVFCNINYLPTAILLPLASHSTHSKILNMQIEVKKPVKKRIWKEIIIAKTEAQIRTLAFLGKPYKPLTTLKKRVQSGDVGNIEAQAAKIYWDLIFGKEFRREYDSGNGINALLNYGYSIVRASVARALCGTGLHPAMGVHHHNQYNPLCLADDLMEPLRPLVDLCAHTLGEQGETAINKETKIVLLSLLSQEVLVEEKRLPLMVAIQHMAASLKNVLAGEAGALKIPQLINQKEG